MTGVLALLVLLVVAGHGCVCAHLLRRSGRTFEDPARQVAHMRLLASTWTW